MTMTQVAAAPDPNPERRAHPLTDAKLAMIEDYLFIRGDQMSARLAAQRLGVSQRSILRYRACLRANPTLYQELSR